MSCKVPPPGWWCSRAEGHDGPCAARPTGPQLKARVQDMLTRAKDKQAGYPAEYCGIMTALAHERWVADLEEILTLLS